MPLLHFERHFPKLVSQFQCPTTAACVSMKICTKFYFWICKKQKLKKGISNRIFCFIRISSLRFAFVILSNTFVRTKLIPKAVQNFAILMSTIFYSDVDFHSLWTQKNSSTGESHKRHLTGGIYKCWIVRELGMILHRE